MPSVPPAQYDAGCERVVVTRLQHRRQRQQAHESHHRADNAGSSREQGAGDEGRNPHGSGNVLGGDIERCEKPVDDVGPLDDVAHEQKQRHRRQHLVRHHRIGLVNQKVKNAVVEEALEPKARAVPPAGGFIQPVEGTPHAARIKIGVVAKADAHGHERECDRKPEEYHENEQPQHHQGYLRVRHMCPPVSASSAFLIKMSSVSLTSSSASSQRPVRMHWMQRKIWAMPWMNSRIPAATITVLNW